MASAGRCWFHAFALAAAATVAILPGEGRSEYLVVYEFYNAAYDHYFRTASRAEMLLLDSQPERGWVRTGHDFTAFNKIFYDESQKPVCRFFAEIHTSHFYTADEAECGIVRARWPDVWTYEGIAFYAWVPEAGRCRSVPRVDPSDVPIAVYRLYNNRASGNHRYVVDAALREKMEQQGWIVEGVVMCVLNLTGLQLQVLEKLHTMKGPWLFDGPMVFEYIRANFREKDERIFNILADYTLPDGTTRVGVPFTYQPADGRFSGDGRQCEIFICATHSFEFVFTDDFDHVSGNHRIRVPTLFGLSDKSNRFEGVRR